MGTPVAVTPSTAPFWAVPWKAAVSRNWLIGSSSCVEPREGRTSGDSPSQVWPLDTRCEVKVAELEFWTADIRPAANS